MLIGGCDDLGAHLYVVGHLGQVLTCQATGFAAIGIGWIYASQALVGFSHTTASTLSETVFSVYAAKRRAEMAPGVGPQTDVLVAQEDGILRLTDAQVAKLATLYDAYQKKAAKEIVDGVAALGLFGNRHKP